MITTLDHLDTYANGRNGTFKFRKILKEVRNFFVIFLIVGGGISLFTNRSLFAQSFTDIFDEPHANKAVGYLQDDFLKSKKHSISSHSTAPTTPVKQKIENLLAMEPQEFSESLEDQALHNFLQKKVGDYSLKFNTLPPVNRLILPKFNQNIPIVDPKFARPIEQIKKGDFEKELYKGIVRYPTTPVPGKPGNTLIFGHTSYESWKYNAYGTIFRNLPKLQNGDEAQIIWKGKMYRYQVIRKKVISPKQINKFYLSYNDSKKDILTLIGCYPLGSDKNRIVVVLERVEG